ncbi:hypothetical protein V1294_002793 [Bradyrhizobium sp. AZCC 1678]|uniref:Transposase n=1 Tax=Bradyrhizobium algeriense TaxID=634784 RepID=A0ABU8BF81_9BRAD
MRHDRGVQAQIIWGANLIPVGGPHAARDDFAPRAGMFAHAGQLGGGGRLGRRRARDARAGGVGSCGVDVRPPSDSRIKSKKPAADFSARALQFLRWWRYAGDLPDMSNRFRMVNELQKNRRNGFDKLKRPRPIVVRNEKPATVSGAGCTISAMMPMCP